MAGKKKEDQMDNLEAIKRLLVLMLIAQDVNLQAIADVLGVGYATVSRMVPQKNFRKKS